MVTLTTLRFVMYFLLAHYNRTFEIIANGHIVQSSRDKSYCILRDQNEKNFQLKKSVLRKTLLLVRSHWAEKYQQHTKPRRQNAT